MNINNRTNHQHIWTPIFKVETQFGKKPPLLLSQSSIFIIKKTSYNLCWHRLIPARRHLPAERLQPSLIYQLPLEGSYNPLTEGFDPQHHCGPRSINFHTGSTSFHTTYLAGHQIYSFSSVHSHQFFMISSVDQTIDSSLSDHYIHGCIVDSDLSIKNRVFSCRYSLEKFIHSPPLRMHTSYSISLLLI